MSEIACPSCGETDALSGQPVRDAADHEDDEATTIEITCQSCAAVWQRSTEVHCPQCDGDKIYRAPVAIVEKSRGSQLSILGTRTTPLCWICDRDLIDAQRQSGTALMPDELPTT